MMHTGALILFAVLSWLAPPAKLADAAAQPADPRVVEWLDKLEARGRELKSFEANVKYDKKDELTADRQIRSGQVYYIASDVQAKTPTRFAILFRQLVTDGKVLPQKLEYIFDGEWLLEKDHQQKRFVKRQVVAPGGKATLEPLSIDGPFPLPLGQKRERVLERFEVTIVEDKGGEAGSGPLHLLLIPRPDAPAQRNQRQFDSVEIWFDRDTLLPTKVKTDEGASTTTVTLTEVKMNQTDAAKIAELFDMTPPKSGWQVESKPWKD